MYTAFRYANVAERSPSAGRLIVSMVDVSELSDKN